MVVDIQQREISAEQVQFRWSWEDCDADFVMTQVNGKTFIFNNYGDSYEYGSIKNLSPDTSYRIVFQFIKDGKVVAIGTLNVTTAHEDTIPPNANVWVPSHTATEATFRLSSDEDGKIYYVFAPGSYVPSVEAILEGTDESGNIVHSGEVDVLADESEDITITGPDLSGSWMLYVVSVDKGGNISSMQGAGWIGL